MAHAHGPYTIASACQIGLCVKYAVGEDALCGVCHQALCREHYDSEEHSCRYTYVDEIPITSNLFTLREDLDASAITKRAQELRPGRTCCVHVPDDLYSLPEELCGGHNIHLVVTFDDGIEWLVRLSGYPMGPVPSAAAKRVLESEAITYEVLGALEGFPIAKLHDWGTGRFSLTNNANCIYLMYDRMPGKSCEEPDSLLGLGANDDERLRLFMDQYVAASIKLSSLTFDAIGSLDRDKSGRVVVGTAADSPWYDENAAAVFGGPFKCLRDKYLFELDRRIDSIRAGRMHRAGPLLPYLIFVDLRRQISSCATLAKEESEFYLAHADTLAHNMLATPDKLTAIVDWEWARTTTKADAFACPFWTVGISSDEPLDYAVPMLVDAYTKAGRPDLAECVKDSGLTMDFDRIFMGPTLCDVSEGQLLGVLHRLSTRLGVDNVDTEEQPSTLREWGQRALKRYATDPYLAEVIKLDRYLQETRKPAPGVAKEYMRRPKQWHYEDFVTNPDLGTLSGAAAPPYIAAKAAAAESVCTLTQGGNLAE